MKLLLALSLVVAACWAETYDEHHDRMVDEINARASTWQAGYNEYFRGQDMKTLKHMLGVRRGYRWGPSHYPRVDEAATPLPENFDARTQWSECASIAHIRDQSRCGSCWAVSTAEMASDRICIGSQGKVQPYISAEDLMTCCYFCGYGCRGGFPIKAAQYWQQDGIVTGGDYGSKHGCQPYEIHGSGPEVNTPSCKKSCISGYSKSYNSDKHYAKSHYYVRGGPSAIQTEVMTKGSVVAAFDVYEDFYHYKSGVYQHTSGGYLGGHAVRIIGWGVENNTPYWLVANSWSDTWGEKGLFKILRGKNECGFEAQCVAGTGSN